MQRGDLLDLGCALGWFLSPKGKAFRHFLFIAGSILLVAVAIGDRGKLGWGVFTLLAVICFIGAFASWFKGRLDGFFDKPTTFGSAEWASYDYLKKRGLLGRGNLHLGNIPGPNGLYPVRYDGDRHALLVAPTRSNKGTAAIIPTLLTYQGSTIVIDPKGENAMITRAAREAMGQQVYVVDPWHITDGDQPRARFNPVEWLKIGDIDITENAMLLADALILMDEGGESFWREEAKALFQGIILFVATDEDEAKDRNLGRVRDLLLLDGLDLRSLFMRMAASPHHVVASTGRRSLQKDEKLLASVMASAQAQTHFLDSPRVRESLSVSDFSFDDLKTTPMSVFLVLPADRLQPFERWLRLMIQQAITLNARNIAIRPKKPVLFVLDEMASLGRLASVEQAFGLMAGFGLQLWGIVQDLSQLKVIYGDRYEGMIANSGVVQYFGSRDRLTTEYFSALCGVTTVWNLSSAVARAFSSSTGKNGGSGSRSITNTETTALAQRKLAYPDELMRIDAGQQLIFIENHNPIRATRDRWFELQHLKNLGRNLHAEQLARENGDG